MPFTDSHGFAVEARTENQAKHLVIAGKTPRGAYNGAVFCRDFLLDTTAGPAGKAEVFVRSASIVRSPRLAARGTSFRATLGKLIGATGALDRMTAIEAALDKVDPGANPKTREGLAIMRRMIDDTRKIYSLAVPDPRALAVPIE